jgi:hypothetical protein
LIWPNLFVISDTALCIRRGIIQKLKEATQKGIFNIKKTLGNIFSKLHNDPIYKYVDKQLHDRLTDDNDIIGEIKSKIRELKIEKIIEQI